MDAEGSQAERRLAETSDLVTAKKSVNTLSLSLYPQR